MIEHVCSSLFTWNHVMDICNDNDTIGSATNKGFMVLPLLEEKT